ncbi:uncharacterized protein F4822DRAFT_138610 [Hypoxylon trugodes]|uniref:uncharacterized protein n=1 Tax=Hypoxylon trugodes TaxID=326681 RepID=UPI00219DFD3D|nr:uncharacterized protein F4822DRAFT_138610 [Hypoxylon trugodes]KAI1392711.1 hypothetical protein F4822DRAFT_138610 [Hypoxylon trugodes]
MAAQYDQDESYASHQYIMATELNLMPHEVILRRTLTPNSIISIKSSFARRFHHAVAHPELQVVVEIGKGLQGSVFEQLGHALAMKKERRGNERLRTSLKKEYSLHSAVLEAFGLYGEMVESTVRVPRLFSIVNRTNDDFWGEYLPKLPEDCRTRGTLVQMERILPLPKIVRESLINYFYPREDASALDPSVVQHILDSTPNKHCLARTYLGRDDGVFTREKFSLRNFPLYLKSMERLGLDTPNIAASMGKAYALMHWGAGVNGDHVEFVLGTSAVRGPKGPPGTPGTQHRAVGLYLIDFGQCESVDLSEEPEEVYQALKVAMVTGDSQLFIPHYRKSPELYSVFKEAYIDAGRLILVEKGLDSNFNVDEFMIEYEDYTEDFL